MGAPEEGRNKGAPAVDDNGSEYGGTPAMAFKTARKISRPQKVFLGGNCQHARTHARSRPIGNWNGKPVFLGTLGLLLLERRI